jgi:alginate O-acetyltransferase complex protein AlgJ
MGLGRLTDILTIGLFLAGIGVMAVISLASAPDARSLARENRNPCPPPTVPTDLHALKKLPAEVDSYFNDRLAFRDSLLSIHARTQTELGASVTDSVIVGKDGWLFQNHATTENPSHGSHRAKEQFDAWSSALQKRYEWLASRGIMYLVVLTPEKQSVHSEHLALGPASESVWAADLLRNWLAHQPIPSIDLLPALREARSQGPLYFRTDSHWNDRGASVGYRAIVDRLNERWPETQPLDRDAFNVESQRLEGDLGRMMRTSASEFEEADFFTLKSPRAHRMPLDVGLDPKLHSPKSVEPQVWGTGDIRQPRCVFFHDSFAERLLRPVLAEHFELVAYAPTASFDPKVVERFQPQIVIQQLLERKINWHNPDPPAHDR